MIAPGGRVFLFSTNKANRINRWVLVAGPWSCFDYINIHKGEEWVIQSIIFITTITSAAPQLLLLSLPPPSLSQAPQAATKRGDAIFSNDINSQLVDTLTLLHTHAHTNSGISLDCTADGCISTHEYTLWDRHTLMHSDCWQQHTHAHTLPDVWWWQVQLVKD